MQHLTKFALLAGALAVSGCVTTSSDTSSEGTSSASETGAEENTTSTTATQTSATNTTAAVQPTHTTVAIATETFGNNPIDVRYNSATDELIFSSGGVDVSTMVRDASLDNRSFAGYSVFVDSDTGFRATTASGGSSVSIGNTAATDFNTIEYKRLQATELPLTGNATYTGEYVGFLTSLNNNEADAVFMGDVNLAVDFAAATVQGSITNRTTHSPADLTPHATEASTDVTLDQTTLTSSGAYTGTASGGTFSINSGATVYSMKSGAYQGVVSGASAGETVGGVSIEFEKDSGGGPTGFRETGVFIATE